MHNYGCAMLTGLGLLAAGGVVLGADTTPSTPARLNVKLGLWEMAMKPQVSGDLSSMVDPQQLQQMTPEQRSRMQAALQQMQAGMQKPRLTKECMTHEKLSRGFDTGNDDKNCKSTIISNTSSDYEAHLTCSNQEGPRSVDVHITAQSAEHVTGTVHSDMSRNGKTMTVNGSIEGRFVSADCGSIKDSEEEKTP